MLSKQDLDLAGADFLGEGKGWNDGDAEPANNALAHGLRIVCTESALHVHRNRACFAFEDPSVSSR